MPYAIRRNVGGCAYAVVNKDTGKRVGCHASRKKALSHLAALYANVPDAREAAATLDVHTRVMHEQALLQARLAGIFLREARQTKAPELARRTLGLREATGDIAPSLRETPEDAGAVVAGLWRGLTASVAKEIARTSLKIAKIVGTDTLRRLGYRQAFSLGESVRQRLIQSSLVAAVEVEDTSKMLLRNVLDRGTLARWSPQRLTSEIQQTMRSWAVDRAELIASTEVALTSSSVQHEVLARNGVEARVWVTMGDDRVDTGHGAEGLCIMNEQAGAIAMNSTFPSGHSYPPAHPRCRCATVTTEGFGSLGRPGAPWTGGVDGGIPSGWVVPPEPRHFS